MSRRVVAALMAAALLPLSACQRADPGVISTSGRVVADTVAAVEVRLGDRVEQGEVILRFDDAALAAQERVAAADADAARSQVALIDAAVETARDKEADLRDKREDVTEGIAEGKKARAELVEKLDDARAASAKLPKQLAKVDKNLRDLKSKRKNAEGRLREVRGTLDKLPAQAPAEQRAQLVAAEKKLAAGVKELTAGIAKLTAARGEITEAKAKLKKAIPQLSDGIDTVDGNLADARDGLAKLDKGIAKLEDARSGLKRKRALAVIAADDTTAVDAARTARERAVVVAPADGIVADIAHLGEVVAPGATVAELSRPAFVVAAWLAPEQANRLCVDDAVSVTLDSLAGPVEGRVGRVLPLADYPPTHQATDQVHLTRAVPVEVTLDAPLPAGVPADLRLSSCQPKR